MIWFINYPVTFILLAILFREKRLKIVSKHKDKVKSNIVRVALTTPKGKSPKNLRKKNNIKK